MDDYSFLDDFASDSSKFKTFSEAKTFDQLGILVLDGSGSMNELSDGNLTLGQIVERAVSKFIEWFQDYSSIKNNISLAIITFDDKARLHIPITPIVKVESSQKFNPLEYHGNGTEIAEGLQLAYNLALEHLNHPSSKKLPHSVVIAVMSDGLTNNKDKALKVAEEINKNSDITICTSLFENPNPVAAQYNGEAKEVLLGIASSEENYQDTHDPDDLRKFFISSMSAQQNYDDSDETDSPPVFD